MAKSSEPLERLAVTFSRNGPAPACPVCGDPVTAYSAETATEWAVKPRYAEVRGLPVGPEFGTAFPGRTTVTLEPCGHQVDEVTLIEAVEKASSLPPFSGDDALCVKCGNEGASTNYLPVGRCLHDGSHMQLGVESNERLHRSCNRCGYEWDEALAQTNGKSAS